MDINAIGLYTFVSREVQKFLRVFVQTLVSPWISAALYIVVFGTIVGTRIDLIAGIPYIEFVLPGVLMLNLISSAFTQTAFSLYFQRFAKHIEEVLVAPLSHLEMIIGYMIGGVARALIVGVGVYGIAIFFDAATIVHPWWFLFYALIVSIIFSFLGLIIGLWAKNFEHLSILSTFIITPLTFLGGVFNSVEMLPEQARVFVAFNPFFYFVDGLRFSMTGIQESNMMVGIIMMLGLAFVLGSIVWYLFKIGWRIRN